MPTRYRKRAEAAEAPFDAVVGMVGIREEIEEEEEEEYNVESDAEGEYEALSRAVALVALTRVPPLPIGAPPPASEPWM
jgi:hypothetical protein